MTTPPTITGRTLGRATRRRVAEVVVRALIYACGWIAIVILAAIAVFLIWNSLPALREVGPGTLLSGTKWYPTSEPANERDGQDRHRVHGGGAFGRLRPHRRRGAHPARETGLPPVERDDGVGG